MFKKKPSRSEFAITVLILIGTLLAGGLTAEQDIPLPIEGIGYVLLASIVYAAYIVSNSRIGKDVNWQNKSAWTMTGSAISILLVNTQSLVFDHHLGLELLEWGVFLAIFGTILPPVLFAIGIPKIGATASSLLMTVELPMAVLSAHFILGERLTTTQVVGIAIMLTAIVMMNLIKSRKRDLLPT